MKVLTPLFAPLVAAIVISVVVAAERLGAQEPPQAAKQPNAKQRFDEKLRELHDRQAPLLARLADEHGYRVEPGKVLQRVAPPFPDARLEYFRISGPSSGARQNGPSAMIFRQQRGGELKNKSMTFSGGSGHSVQGLIGGLAGIRSQMIEGGDVREASVQGDWVFRDGAEPEEIIEQLAAILRDELGLDVNMEFRHIERPVYVARGTYAFEPLKGGRKRRASVRDGRAVVTDPIEIFAGRLMHDHFATRPTGDHFAGGGSGQFEDLLVWLGDWIGEPIVSDLEAPPEGRFSWQLHRRSPATDQTRAEDHDPKLVLPNITAQTGLTFTLEQRPFKTLFVEGTR